MKCDRSVCRRHQIEATDLFGVGFLARCRLGSPDGPTSRTTMLDGGAKHRPPPPQWALRGVRESHISSVPRGSVGGPWPVMATHLRLHP
jgi:hypothetical protein